jgi:hypothetical protein
MSNLSNYPNGIEFGYTYRGLPLSVTHPGKIFYANSTAVLAATDDGLAGADTPSAGTYQRPFATIDYSIGQCVAGRGDKILVMPGHTETISAAAGIAMDVAGVAVVGLGYGSLRPTINYTATASTLTMSAANCIMHNVLHTGGIDAVVSPIVVSAADCLISANELRDVTGQMTDGILTTNAADRLKVLNHIHDGAAAAGTNSAIAIVGGDNIEVTIDKMDGNFAVGGLDVRTTATTDLHVHDVKYFRTRNSADIFAVDTITGSTGQFGPNVYMRLQDNGANITGAITGATFVVMDDGVHVVNLANEKSIAINWTASTDA